MAIGPKWRRRKDARPSDIVAAALTVFGEKGFAGARIEEIARRAGVSKGTVYLYFETKSDIFRAVVHDAIIPNIEDLKRSILALDLPFAQILSMLLPRFAALVTELPVGAVVKMVVGESRNFPELAKVWHDEVVQQGVGLLSALIERGQSRGEIRPGDPRTHAFSIMGPILIGMLWRETFTPVGGAAVNLPAIARQHAETILGGLLITKDRP
ncbi:MAG TPA: TetR/AcrR family transcriptional regulator [Allosphingosinicella sp.]|nr:TetR/AcrR family transcriptional regulator [Allosphingosinicella sp.]